MALCFGDRRRDLLDALPYVRSRMFGIGETGNRVIGEVKNEFFFSRSPVFLFSVSLMFFFAPVAHACPFCKEAISRMGEIWTSIGFNLSIYFMMAIPFLIVAGFGFVLYFNYRKHQQR